MKQYITKKEALKIFIKEHPEFKIVDYNFLYGKNIWIDIKR